ncbi:MAG: phosphoribosyltransferase family protein [bacterium]|nr:phosphoribosyltransferase family protein [bacterium]
MSNLDMSNAVVSNSGAASPTVSELTASNPKLIADLTAVIAGRGLLRLQEPVRLASGAMSQDFIDIKRALCEWEALRLACQVIAEGVEAAGISFDAAGGMTMGADPLAVGIAAVCGSGWFSVRKTPKARGTNKLIEGTPLGVGQRVLLLEDTTTTGGSALRALEVVRKTGAEVVAFATVVNRGDSAQRSFSEAGVAFFAALTYEHLGIDPVVPPDVPGSGAGPLA